MLATSFPTRISLENRFFLKLAKLVNSLHENGCFSMVSVFRGVSPNLGPLPGLLLASCWPLAGLLLASFWLLAGLLLATSFPTKTSLENQFFTRLAKLVNSLHENGCFSNGFGVSWGPPHLGSLPGLLASCWPLAGLWPLAGFLLASCWSLAGLLLASCSPLAGLLLASCWPLAGLLLASCWLQASPQRFL